MKDWLPIETAPKDGTPVVVYDGTDACVAQFVPEVKQGRHVLHAWWVRCNRRRAGSLLVRPKCLMPYKGTLCRSPSYITRRQRTRIRKLVDRCDEVARRS